MEVLCLAQIIVVEMPVYGCFRIVVYQFNVQLPFAAIQLFREEYPGIHRRVDKLHGAEHIFAASGFERREWFIFRVMLFVIPFPYGRQGKPAFLNGRFHVDATFVDTESSIGRQVDEMMIRAGFGL